MKRIFVMLVAFTLCLAPLMSQDTTSRPTKVKVKGRKMGLAKPLVFEGGKEVYGAHLAGKPYVALKTVAKESKKWNGKKVQLRGKVTAVCSKKGCWMKLKEGDEEVRVKFTGYSFFVPLDSAGQDVAVEGTVVVKIEKEAERRHYAEDAGKSPEEIAKIKGDKTTVSFMADAVQMGKLPPLKKAKDCGGAGGCDMKGGEGGCGNKAGGGCGGCSKKGEGKAGTKTTEVKGEKGASGGCCGDGKKKIQ
jgi:hypothetical protein